MPKGKKFDAAEKHFLSQKEKLDRTIRDLRSALERCTKEKKELSRQLELERRENSYLRQKLEVLESTAGLTRSEVRDLVNRAQSLNAIAGVTAGVSQLLSGY